MTEFQRKVILKAAQEELSLWVGRSIPINIDGKLHRITLQRIGKLTPLYLAYETRRRPGNNSKSHHYRATKLGLAVASIEDPQARKAVLRMVDSPGRAALLVPSTEDLEEYIVVDPASSKRGRKVSITSVQASQLYRAGVLIRVPDSEHHEERDQFCYRLASFDGVVTTAEAAPVESIEVQAELVTDPNDLPIDLPPPAEPPRPRRPRTRRHRAPEDTRPLVVNSEPVPIPAPAPAPTPPDTPQPVRTQDPQSVLLISLGRLIDAAAGLLDRTDSLPTLSIQIGQNPSRRKRVSE